MAMNKVAAVLERESVTKRRRGLDEAHVPEAARLYEAGWSVARLGEHFGVSPTTVWEALRKAGVQLREPWERRGS